MASPQDVQEVVSTSTTLPPGLPKVCLAASILSSPGRSLCSLRPRLQGTLRHETSETHITRPITTTRRDTTKRCTNPSPTTRAISMKRKPRRPPCGTVCFWPSHYSSSDCAPTPILLSLCAPSMKNSKLGAFGASLPHGCYLLLHEAHGFAPCGHLLPDSDALWHIILWPTGVQPLKRTLACSPWSGLMTTSLAILFLPRDTSARSIARTIALRMYR